MSIATRKPPSRLRQHVWEIGQALQWSMGIPIFIVFAFILLVWLHMRSIPSMLHRILPRDPPALQEPALVGSEMLQ